jgi:hypothetical protein
MPERNDDDGGAQELARGACHGGADLAPTSMCGGATMVVRTRSMYQQVTAHWRWHLFVMVMLLMMVMLVMRAQSISVVVVVRAGRVMLVAVARCGQRNQKQCRQHCYWNSHGIHGDTSLREAGNYKLPLSLALSLLCVLVRVGISYI